MKCRIRFILFLLTISQNIWAGDTLSKYVVIDTVLIEKDVSIKKLKGDSDFIELLTETHYLKVTRNWLEDSYPNVSSKVFFTKKDSLEIGLVIDDKGSTVYLNNIEKLGDTIHIEKWTVFHNDLTDTAEKSISYYHHINDSTIRAYKHKGSISYSGNDKNMRKSISFILMALLAMLA